MRPTWILLCGLAACSDRYGAYLDFTGPAFAHVDLYFGGSLGSCSSEKPIQTLLATASWTNTNPDRTRDRMFRLQDVTPSSFSVAAGSTHATYYLAASASIEAVGQIVIAVATDAAGNTVGVGELDDFAPTTGSVDVYDVALHPVAAGEVEPWGPQGTAPCVRWTHPDTTGQPASTFIVLDNDRDCDGIVTDACANPPQLNDCDPMRWCGVTANGQNTVGCSDGNCTEPATTMGECFVAPSPGGASSCTNTPGVATWDCMPGVAEPFCLSKASCSDAVCDRSVLDCAAVGVETPDLSCTIPVTTAGLLCMDVVPIVLTTTDSCGLILDAATVNPQRQNGVSFLLAADTSPACVLEIATEPAATSAVAGTLSHTRLLVEAPANVTIAGSLVIDLRPAPGDCTAMPACTPAAAAALPTNSCSR